MMNWKLIFVIALILFSCKTGFKNSQTKLSETANKVQPPTIKTETGNQVVRPGVIVYKTKGNYNNLVPIRLSDDKTQILSYPAPSDLKKEGIFSTPTELDNDFLIDNIGISKNTAFLKLTYEEYSKLTNTILLSEMYKLILDKEPFKEMYDCGSKEKFTNIINQLNQQINKGELDKIYKKIL